MGTHNIGIRQDKIMQEHCPSTLLKLKDTLVMGTLYVNLTDDLKEWL